GCFLASIWLLCLFFFFQAEDGIRDFHVTGVQTCALPIYRSGTNRVRDSRRPAGPAQAGAAPATGDQTTRLWPRGPPRVLRVSQRSEERRVGKECRSRRRVEQSKRNESKTAGSVYSSKWLE